MVERGHSLESIQQSIEARKPDFDAFVAPQRGDVVIQVLPTDLIPDEKEGKVLKVKFIQKEGKDKFDNLQELIYVESHLSNTATKFYGELTQQMLKMSDAPGSDNGTGFFQTLCALKIREIYEKITSKKVAADPISA